MLLSSFARCTPDPLIRKYRAKVGILLEGKDTNTTSASLQGES